MSRFRSSLGLLWRIGLFLLLLGEARMFQEVLGRVEFIEHEASEPEDCRQCQRDESQTHDEFIGSGRTRL